MLNPLYAKFETDTKKESDGVWFEYDIGEGDKNPRFLVRRFNDRDKQFRVNSRKNMKPYAMLLGEKAETPEKEVEQLEIHETITMKTYIDSFLIGWENIADRDNNPIEFSTDAALDFFKKFHTVYSWLVEKSMDIKHYRSEFRGLEVKNS